MINSQVDRSKYRRTEVTSDRITLTPFGGGLDHIFSIQFSLFSIFVHMTTFVLQMRHVGSNWYLTGILCVSGSTYSYTWHWHYIKVLQQATRRTTRLRTTPRKRDSHGWRAHAVTWCRICICAEESAQKYTCIYTSQLGYFPPKKIQSSNQQQVLGGHLAFKQTWEYKTPCGMRAIDNWFTI